MKKNDLVDIASPAIFTPVSKHRFPDELISKESNEALVSKSKNCFIFSRIILIGIIFISTSAFSQAVYHDAFLSKGIEVVSQGELNHEQIQKILQFNFEIYRKEHDAVFVNILNGPTLALHSQDRINGITPKEIDLHFHSNENSGIVHDHDEILEGFGPYLRINVFTIEVF